MIPPPQMPTRISATAAVAAAAVAAAAIGFSGYTNRQRSRQVTPPPPVCVSVRRMDHTAWPGWLSSALAVGRMSWVARRPRLTGSEGRGVQFQTLAHRSIMWRRGVAI